MKTSRTAPFWLAALALAAFEAPAEPSSPSNTNYALSQQAAGGPRKYHFVAWPKGSAKPVYFRSGLYAEGDSAAFVRLDDNRLFGGTDAGIRYPDAFDSLKASRIQPVFIAGAEYALDSTWTTATVLGRRWIFPRLSGAVTLWSKSPGAGSYAYMDTGAGLEPYREAAVRRKIGSEPAAAKFLRKERAGRTAAWTMALGGGGLAVAGAATSFKESGFAPNGLVFAGIGLAAFSWIPHLMVEGSYEKAVRAYNAALATRAEAAPAPVDATP